MDESLHQASQVTVIPLRWENRGDPREDIRKDVSKVGNPGRNDLVMPKFSVNGRFEMEGRSRPFSKIPIGASKHMTVVDEESLLSIIVRSPEENSLPIVLMIRPNV